MGLGDELMAAGLARARRARDPQQRRVRILDRDKRPRWHPLWERNRDLVRPGESGDFISIINGPGARPYIADKAPTRWTWKPCDNVSARMSFSQQERLFASAQISGPCVVIETTIKAKASPNKQWPARQWEAFVDLARGAGLELVQLGQVDAAPWGVRYIHTPDFRSAMATLARASAYVGHEGAMHHAAAAVGVPAVVIHGGYIAPQVTGYPGQVALFKESKDWPLGCGARQPCEHCRKAMAAIEPQDVLDALGYALAESAAHNARMTA